MTNAVSPGLLLCPDQGFTRDEIQDCRVFSKSMLQALRITSAYLLQDKRFDCAEVCMVREGGEDDPDTVVFQGALWRGELSAPVTGKVFIASYAYQQQFQSRMDGHNEQASHPVQPVHFADNNRFNNRFLVFATHPESCRAYFTPERMDQLCSLAESNPKRFRVCIDGSTVHIVLEMNTLLSHLLLNYTEPWSYDTLAPVYTDLATMVRPGEEFDTKPVSSSSLFF
jgi:hypothetical protein